LVLALAADRGGDGDPRSIRQFQMPGIAGLAARSAIEDRAVEYNASTSVHGGNPALCVGKISVVAKKRFGHRDMPRFERKFLWRRSRFCRLCPEAGAAKSF